MNTTQALESSNLDPVEPVTPADFRDLFRHLRLRAGLTAREFGQRVRYSHSAVEINETTTRNPSMKTILRYITALDLEMVVSARGITIHDPATRTMIVRDWLVEVP